MKKRWKKILSVLMVGTVMVGSLTACGGDKVNIPVRQHRKSGRRETVCPGLRKPLMRVYSRNVLSKP